MIFKKNPFFFFPEFEQIPWFIIFIVMVAQAPRVRYLHIVWKLFLVESFWNIWIWFPEQLMTLISAAREHEIEFIYAISPGLDITFSNPKEVSTLKRKLDQVNVIWASCSCSPTSLEKLQYHVILLGCLSGKFEWMRSGCLTEVTTDHLDLKIKIKSAVRFWRLFLECCPEDILEPWS